MIYCNECGYYFNWVSTRCPECGGKIDMFCDMCGKNYDQIIATLDNEGNVINLCRDCNKKLDKSRTVISSFDQAVEVVLEHEGGYTEDHAGATNFGITLRSLDVDIDMDGDIDADDIRAMTREDAIAFYKRRWWDKYRYYKIHNALIAGKILDLAVNMGARQAAKIAQRALRACGHPVKVDGVLGDISYRTMNTKTTALELLPAIRSEAAGFYRELIALRPEFKKYKKGWLNRAYS